MSLVVPSQVSQIGKRLVNRRVELPEQRHQFVAYAIAGVNRLSVARVSAPGLVRFNKKSFDRRTANREKWPKNLACLMRHHRVDRAEAFRPGPAEQLQQDSLRLIVQGVRRQDGGRFGRGQQGFKERITKVAGSFFNRLARPLDAVEDAGMMDVEGNIEPGTEALNEDQIVIRLYAAKAMVDVDGGETNPKRLSGGMERKEQGNGVSPTRDRRAKTVARTKMVAI